MTGQTTPSVRDEMMVNGPEPQRPGVVENDEAQGIRYDGARKTLLQSSLRFTTPPFGQCVV